MTDKPDNPCRCPYCHGEMESDQSFCMPCSVEIARCPACNRPLPKTAKTCPACGTPRPEATERKRK